MKLISKDGQHAVEIDDTDLALANTYKARGYADPKAHAARVAKAQSGADESGYDALSVKELQAEIDTRVAAGASIEPAGSKKADLVAALTANDAGVGAAE